MRADDPKVYYETQAQREKALQALPPELPDEKMPGGRFNADTPLDAETRRKVEVLKRNDNVRLYFERVREKQLREHEPLSGASHTAAQKANATQMGNKAVAMKYLGWP